MLAHQGQNQLRHIDMLIHATKTTDVKHTPSVLSYLEMHLELTVSRVARHVNIEVLSSAFLYIQSQIAYLTVEKGKHVIDVIISSGRES